MAAGAGEAPKEEHNPMMHRVVVDEVPFKRKLVELTTHTTCAEAMQTLVDNKLETAPVWDEETRCYVGFVGMADFAKLYVDAMKHSDVREPVNSMDALMEATRRLELGPSRFVNMARLEGFENVVLGTPLIEVVRMLTREKKPRHRVPVIDPSTGKITKRRDAVSKVLAQPLAEKSIGTETVVCIDINKSVLKALDLMVRFGYHGIGVLEVEGDQKGALVANLSLSDIRVMAYPESFKFLQGTVREFLEVSNTKVGRLRPAHRYRPAVTVSTDSTVGAALDAFVEHNVHRVYVTEPETQLPRGIITLTDLLRCLNVIEA